ncbi:MAG: metalloregulator ArsR/SmtB family transcription factor [bacterium]|nr:metalloregulator ArsR/SmtB family transcription factor [bacterium]
MERYTEVLKAAGEKTRLRIIRLLLESKSPLCVCEIMDCLEETQTNISKHLKILKYTGIIKEEKKGKWVMYSLSPNKDDFLISVIKAIKSISCDKFNKEIKNLKKRMELRKKGMPVVGIKKGKC